MLKKILKYLFNMIGYEFRKINLNKDFWQTDELFLGL